MAGDDDNIIRKGWNFLAQQTISNGGQTKAIGQKGSTDYLVGLKGNHFLRIASVRSNTKFRSQLST